MSKETRAILKLGDEIIEMERNIISAHDLIIKAANTNRSIQIKHKHPVSARFTARLETVAQKLQDLVKLLD